jgi:hypothetical protein
MTKFIGRAKELDSLKGLQRKKSSSLVVIRGRRRIGKSRLAEEYAASFSKAYILSGIPPEPGVTAEAQRAEFLRQLQEYKLPIYRDDDWGNLFFDLAQECKKGPILAFAICMPVKSNFGKESWVAKLLKRWKLSFVVCNFREGFRFVQCLSTSTASLKRLSIAATLLASLTSLSC